MNRRAIEPGLLPAFRFLIGVRTALLALALVLYQTGWAPDLLAAIEALGLPGREALAPYDLAASVILLVYLSWPALQRRLGRAYLPIALAAVSIPLILISAAAVASEPAGDAGVAAAVRRSGRLVFQLSVPAILTAWQYGFSGVLVFSVLTTGLELSVIQATVALDGRPGLLMAGLSVGRIAMFCMIGFLVHHLAESQRAQRLALAKANRELGRYAAALEELAISRERNRLARELHDTLAHSLSALAVQLEGLRAVWDSSPAEARTMLDHSLEITRRGLVEARRAIRELRTTPVEGLGLALALRQLAESAAERARVDLALEIPERIELPAEVEQGIYRIAEEALANVARHAGARSALVRLEPLGAGVRLTIGDDGAGFDPQAADADGHFGLQGMRERAGLIGGELSVDSRPGAGTTLRLTVGAAR